LIKEDFPTLERPMKAISGNSLLGKWTGADAPVKKSA